MAVSAPQQPSLTGIMVLSERRPNNPSFIRWRRARSFATILATVLSFGLLLAIVLGQNNRPHAERAALFKRAGAVSR
jgi:hypothetical protein